MPIQIEFTAENGQQSYKEDSVTLRTPEELFEYVAPGGDCERIPSDVAEIQMVFLAPEHIDGGNAVAGKRVTLQLGRVFLSGPLSIILATTQQLIDKAGSGGLSPDFMAAIGA